MDVLSAILACSLYARDDALVRAIAESTPEGNPYSVLDASASGAAVDETPPSNALEAHMRLRAVTDRGGRPLLGLLQIPPAWMTALGREPADAFDPCTNVAVGTAMLSAYAARCERPARPTGIRSRPKPAPSSLVAVRQCVLAQYGEAIGERDFALVTTLELRHQRVARPALAEGPIFLPAAFGAAGPRSPLVPLGRLSSLLASPP